MIKHVSIFLLVISFCFGCGNNPEVDSSHHLSDVHIQNGDIIFQTSKSGQSKAIQLATNSAYSHMGIIYEQGGKFLVYEAVQPVKLTPLKDWIKRGENEHFVLKRLRNADQILTSDVQIKMKKVGRSTPANPMMVFLNGQTIASIALNWFGKSTKTQPA